MPFPRLIKRRQVIWPTVWGWLLLILIFALPTTVWLLRGEDFLSQTSKQQPAEILVVEGWIGNQGLELAAREYQEGGYKLAVGTGSFSGEKWDDRRWNYGIVAAQKLAHYGVPKDKILCAPARDTESDRTYESAVATADALQKAGRHPTRVNILTRGSHARRSRLVFARILGSGYEVGVISWHPPGYDDERWWNSSERAKAFILETMAWAHELLFNSFSRHTNHELSVPSPPTQ
jgi:uncharacterized SAM-binding protein YcdF (DUF218 family)